MIGDLDWTVDEDNVYFEQNKNFIIKLCIMNGIKSA